MLMFASGNGISRPLFVIVEALILFSRYHEVNGVFPISRNDFLKISASPSDVEDTAVTNLRDYLRINSAHPSPDYRSCIDWLRKQGQEIGLDFHLEYFQKPDLFALWLTWNGTDPALKSILINSHMDVVAVDLSKWKHDPFGAYKDEQGNIFGRGAIDMKSATVGVLEAIRRLKTSGFIPLRTVHVSIVPDEELLGNRGMKAFAKSAQFFNLNVGFDMDEASPGPSDTMFIPHGEKSIWQFNITARGVAAHASTLPVQTAGQKLQVVIDKLFEFRQSQLQQLDNPNMTIENITSLNLIRLGGGTANNVIPDELWASFDMRILLKPGWNFTDVEAMLINLTKEAGSDVSYKFIQKSMESGQTAVDNSNVWWTVVQKTCNQLNVSCVPEILSAVSDGRYLRDIGIPVFGINPFLQTTVMAHQDDEYINEKKFLEGIDRYVAFIRNFASVS